MAPTPSSNAATTSVQVALRIRPTTNHDTNSIPARFQRSVITAVNPTTVSVDAVPAASNTGASPAASGKKQLFTFDQVHPPTATQHTLFTSTAQPLISRFVEGFNCTILAYGQTSSGKTFTMTGIDLDLDPSSPSNGMGIIPRAVSTIFSRCRELKEERGTTWQYNVKGSFIEIYNEDLIDLLSMDGTGKREVQIREDKQGHIIWEGLREVSVKNSNEVMSLIRQGTAIRRTNETDMNAQSSRSHAIFSLTLIQKKFTGSAPPARSPSPLPPGGRPLSRIARPGSTFSGSRVSSPTFGRPGTPSFQQAMSRGGRPSSSLGLLSPDMGRSRNNNANADGDDEQGEWTTAVSKFHFVDLAGSERLKRTAAAGERVKEGISINSGLLALGNVISALGDPARAKSHTASYVPYRDSKLTRLLQDSLGGNAHTLMIACVSPSEWNLNETVNTLKYANRARNIKNRVVLNEKEEGWDDVEWLQGMVTRLRKEAKALRDGAPGSITIGPGALPEMEGAGKKVLAQMSELQNNYEDLREKFVERTEELTRLRRELAEKQRNSKGGHIGGTAKYEEIVGPVIEEYEKTISAMEAELSLNRAALRHTNDLYEEQETEFNELSSRHATTEAYLEELKSRIARLSEREASNEAYIRDLEEKVKQYDESSVSSSGSITDLKREITRYKDTESYSSQYIADLEARLARADESVLSLRESVEKLENECERRKMEAEVLQSRLDNLKKDGVSWRTDLEEREKNVHALELKMEEWQAKMKEAGEDRERLGGLVDEVAKARKDLEASSPTKTVGSSAASFVEQDGSVESQLVALRQTHTATLKDLSSVSDKYRDALHEIADLAAQLEEAKVNALIPPSETPDRSVEFSPRRRMIKGVSRDGIETPVNGAGKRLLFRQAASTESLHARSVSQSLSLSQELSSVRSRKASISSHGTSSSISLSPSLGHLRPNLSITLPSSNSGERSVASLEKEIMRLQEVLKEREAEITVLEDSLKSRIREEAPPSTESPGVSANGTSYASPTLHLSPKTMDQFQELRRSLDLHAADENVQDSDGSLERLNELMRSMAQKESSHREIVDGLNADLSQVRRQFEELTVLSRDQTLNMSMELEALRNRREEDLVKHSEDMKQLEQIEHREVELVESLAQMRLHEDDLTHELEQVQHREAKLLESLKLAKADHAAEIEQLKSEHEEALHAKAIEVDGILTQMREVHEGTLNDLRDQLVQASAALEKAQQDHEAAFGKLKADHEEELRRRSQAVDEMLENTRVEHEAALSNARVEHEGALKKKGEEAAATLLQTEEEYYNALTKLRTDHAQALEKQTAEAATAMERLRDEHARDMRMAEIARDGSLSQSQSARDVAIKGLQDEHASAIANKEKLFADDMQKLKDEHVAALSAKVEQHRSAVERLKDDHAANVNKKEVAHVDEVEKLQAEHSRALAAKEHEHHAALDQSAAEHSAALSKLQEELSQEIFRLKAELENSRTELTASNFNLREKMEADVQAVKEQQAAILQEVERGHQDEVARLSEAQQDALAALETQAQEQRASLVQSHADDVATLKAEHERALAEAQAGRSAAQEQHRQELADAMAAADRMLEERLASVVASHVQALAKLRSEHHTALAEADASLIAAQDQHHQELEDSRVQTEHLLAEEKERLTASLTKMQKVHAAERETIEKDHDLLVSELQAKSSAELGALSKEHALLLEELESHKAASNEYVALREEARQTHEKTLQQRTDTIGQLQSQLSSVHDEREELATEVAKLRAELQDTRQKTTELVTEASKRQSLVEELERHRSELAEMQENLQRTKDEMDNLQAEKNKQDSLLRDLQSQIVRTSSSGDPLGRSAGDRGLSFTRVNGMSPTKLPPPTPPPSGPIPPAPRSMHEPTSSSASSAAVTIASSMGGDTPLESPSTPATSIAHLPPTTNAVDQKTTVQLQQQAKQIEEQDAMIKTLNKQLTHCESDLQAHMDLVATLESSLGDSEKNLRKARMQATEYARERDNLSSQMTNLRAELQDAKSEVVNVRRSIVEEKQSLEHRLDEERRQKERARAQLDSRMDELQRRKSKFACL